MASKFYIPGLMEYGQCKTAFLRTQELLSAAETAEHKEELSALRNTLERNPDAVDFLKAEFGKEYAPVYQRLADACVSSFLLDEHAADNGRKRLQPDWFDYWSNINDGRVMASMGDLYASFKIMKKMHEGTEQEKAKAKSLLFSLRDDFDWPRKQNWLIASTRLIYSGNSLDARIVQHYRCNQPELVKETLLEVPVYKETPVETVMSKEVGLMYMKTYFDTEDASETIIQTLEFISSKNRKDIRVWTAGWSADSESAVLKNRAEFPERAAGFFYDYDLFHVDGVNFDYDPGCSRGVRR